MLFVPAAITGRLAGSKMILAVDFSQMDLGPVLAKLPRELGCAVELAKTMGVAVLAGAPPSIHVYATKLSEAKTRTCLEHLLPRGGIRKTGEHAYDVQVSDDRLTVTWEDGITSIRQAGSRPPLGLPSVPLLRLAMHIPVDAMAFMVTEANEGQTTKGLAVWARTDADAFEITARAEGNKPGDARALIREFLAGAREEAMSKQFVIEDSWIRETVDEPVATLHVRIPFAALR